ncbi:efflux RND transporter periplasmic adaptor subunit [Parapedobacter deserti]|uniref:Efflux RND transporter periplasmic adaptor subunit n=1 Tax=Parapedobacter deserti TaxID=1912957 RepID=A0ABV7JJ13_9SPHI
MKTKLRSLLLFVLSGLSSCRQPAETQVVETRSLREAVYASGEILPLEYEYTAASNPERIHRILVNEGDTVNAGQVLVILGTPSEDEQLGILSNQVALARENASEQSAAMAELYERIALAKQQYQQDSLDARRYAELAVSQAVSRKQAEEVAMRAASRHTEYNNLRKQLELLRNELHSNVLAAENQLAQFRRGREGRVLTSRIHGRVFSVHREPGEIVNAQDPILLVGTPDRFRLEMLVDERDIAKVKVGQPVVFETDAYAGRQFRATVDRVIPVLQKENRSFEIWARVLDDLTFFPNSTVEANIVVRDSVEVLAVPADYVVAGDSIWVKTESGNEQKVRIQSGIRDRQFVEVIRGLQPGNVIVKKAP